MTRPALRGLTVALTLLLAACADDPTVSPTLTPAESEPTPTDTSSRPSEIEPTTSEPDGQRSLFIASVSTSNSSIPPPHGMVETPQMVLLADGRVRANADSEIAELQLTPDELDAIVQELTDADLGRFVGVEPVGEPLVGGTTSTLIVDVGEPIEIVASGIGPRYPEDLLAVVARLEALAESARTSGTRVAPERVRLYAAPAFADMVGPEMSWPTDVPVPDSVDESPNAPLETEYEGAEAAAVIDAFGGEEFAVWTLPDPDRAFQVAWVPLLI